MAAGVSEYIERVETDGGEVESDIYVSESVEDLGDFFDDASLVNIPTAYKSTKLYSIKPTDGSGDFTFSRSTTGTRINESGLIESVGVNVPRIDYSSGTPSLLLEPQRTNLIPYSEYFAAWAPSGLTITDNNATSPEGVLNAAKLTLSSGVTVKRITLFSMPISAIARSYSFFVKSDDITAVQLVHSGDIQGYARFDISNGVVGSLGSKTTSSIENYGNGWYRCIANFDATNTFGSTIYLYVSDNASGGYGGSTAAEGDLFVYGAQYEEGSYPTSYIPTSGTSVTRTIDAITNSVSYALSNGYTIFIELQTQSLAVSNDIEFKDASNNYVFRVGDEVIVGAGLFTQANTIGFNKFALQVDAAGNYELFKNGSSVTSGSGIAHDIEVISSVAGQDVRQILVFEQALTDAECITLTT